MGRSLRPLVTLVSGGSIGIGLAAPKLLPLLATFKRAPRVIDSPERLDVGAFVTLLTSREQAFYQRPALVSPYGWHEWGMYIGPAFALVVLIACLFVPGAEVAWLKAIALLFVALGFGSFHEYAPWTLLHAHAPVFRSQHVPSRFLYPAMLVLGIIAAKGIDRIVERHDARIPWLDAFLAACVFVGALDVASVAQKPMKDAMWMVAPDDIPRSAPFRYVDNPIYNYRRRDWAAPMYLSMLGNTGVLNCYGAPPFEGKGALSPYDRRFRGDVFLDGGGSATVSHWSPNQVEIESDAATDGELLVYNMNFDPGFSARVTTNGNATTVPAMSTDDRVSVHVPAGRSVVVFQYSPPRMGIGIAMAVVTVGALALAMWLERRRRMA
jgi:hypothetical protein